MDTEQRTSSGLAERTFPPLLYFLVSRAAWSFSRGGYPHRHPEEIILRTIAQVVFQALLPSAEVGFTSIPSGPVYLRIAIIWIFHCCPGKLEFAADTEGEAVCRTCLSWFQREEFSPARVSNVRTLNSSRYGGNRLSGGSASSVYKEGESGYFEALKRRFLSS